MSGGLLGLDPPRIQQPDDSGTDQGAALAQTYQAVSDYMRAQQAKSAQMGLWDDTAGMPTQAGLLNVAQQYANAVMMGTTSPAKLSGAVETTPGYVYHATNAERLQDIADTGKLLTHKPEDFTDQDVWPDGGTEKRNYFTPSAANTWQFAPDEGTPALLRMPQDAHPVRTERGTGDLYSTKPVPAGKMEYHGSDGNWHPVSDLRQSSEQ